MMRQNTSKKIQQSAILAKNYLEQRLETQGNMGRVKYDAQQNVQFKTEHGYIAVLKGNTLQMFAKPIKKCSDSLPVDLESVDIGSIKTSAATYCKKCKEWKMQACVTKCTCGGYLVSRKRFSTEKVKSWDEEFLETQFARKDIANAKRIDRILSHRPKKYVPTGITYSMAGMSSVCAKNAKKYSRVSAHGATWLESFGVSPLFQNVVIRKIDGFVIPPNEDIQVCLRARLAKISEANN
jgi:hypothetical protein